MKRWPLNKAYFWEKAPFFRLLLPLAAGIVCYDRVWLPRLSGFVYLLIIAGLFLLFSAVAYRRKSGGVYPYINFVLFNLMLFIGGYTISHLCDIRNDRKWFGNTLEPKDAYVVSVTDHPSEKEHSWKVPVKVIRSIKGDTVTEVAGDALIYIYKDSLPVVFHKGDLILVPTEWEPIRNAGNPFEFDYAAYCRRSNVLFRQFCSVADIHLYARPDPGQASFTDRAHDWCMAQLDKYIPDHKTRGLMQAMLLGDERNLDEGLRLAYSETGIIHIIAISGGNVAIFFIVISFLLWWLRDKKHLWIKFAIALPLVWFYVLMAGAPPSAVRAALMFSLLAISVMLQKNNNSLSQLFATAFLLLCVQPMWLFSVGFQLSFIAVLSLILFYTPVYKWLSPVHKISRVAWGVVAASIAAEVLVAPLVIYYFHTFPLMFLIANVAAYIFMGIVLILGIAIIVLSAVSAVAGIIGTCAVWLVGWFDGIVVWLQGLNPPSFHLLVLTGLELILVYIAISGILVFFMKKYKPALFIALAAACFFVFMLCTGEWHHLHQQRLVAYNVAGTNHIELINGRNFCLMATDTARQKKINYAVKEAHINWRASTEGSRAPNEIFTIKGKTVLVLNTAIDTGGTFPVHYLVVNNLAKLNLAKLRRVFSPSVIVIGNNYSRRQQDRIVRAYANSGIRVHSIAKDGALVVD